MKYLKKEKLENDKENENKNKQKLKFILRQNRKKLKKFLTEYYIKENYKDFFLDMNVKNLKSPNNFEIFNKLKTLKKKNLDISRNSF